MISVRVGIAALLLAAAAAPAHATLYDDLGGKETIVSFTNDFVDRLNSDLPHLKYELAEQFCSLAAGPCKYTGRTMEAAHKGMELHDADFNALAEDLQSAMDAAQEPFTT